ncbi:hypothetical protein [Burkholderia ambifaria]|uniref:hypothetical protein n=1 Tax=Burkholderia ambifaria TaxID=152480 RepID=UPI001FC82100|nr:hypothetical protein [Burkholderia ambifaria]WDR88237.1 hypothetical protein OR986_09650 [Burkholderia ambifaria]WDS00971.1 hypothetical protein OR985_14610 [Burkholderia ambifaria]
MADHLDLRGDRLRWIGRRDIVAAAGGKQKGGGTGERDTAQGGRAREEHGGEPSERKSMKGRSICRRGLNGIERDAIVALDHYICITLAFLFCCDEK